MSIMTLAGSNVSCWQQHEPAETCWQHVSQQISLFDAHTWWIPLEKPIVKGVNNKHLPALRLPSRFYQVFEV